MHSLKNPLRQDLRVKLRSQHLQLPEELWTIVPHKNWRAHIVQDEEPIGGTHKEWKVFSKEHGGLHILHPVMVVTAVQHRGEEFQLHITSTNIINTPFFCSERLYMDMADRLAADGYKDMGYEYVNIDDCWMEMERDEQGRLVADIVRFPSGIKSLADYVHSKGLKLGIYIDCGTKTCAGYPGSYGHFETDAQTFADWGVDMLKVDGCYADPKEMDDIYPQIGAALNKTGRPILYSCSWPDYQRAAGMTPNYTRIAECCNIWRNFDDIEDSWQSILIIIDYYASQQDDLVEAAGPGHFNDPDMILVGNFGLSFDEARAQFALWTIMASPLVMSNDLRTISPEFKDLLLNKDIIAVNQDPLGMMGKRIYSENNIEIWKRPISPVGKEGLYSYAMVVLNRRDLGGPVKVTVQLASIGMSNQQCYKVRDVFNEQQMRRDGLYCPLDDLTVVVNPSGVTMVIAEVVL